MICRVFLYQVGFHFKIINLLKRGGSVLSLANLVDCRNFKKFQEKYLCKVRYSWADIFSKGLSGLGGIGLNYLVGIFLDVSKTNLVLLKIGWFGRPAPVLCTSWATSGSRDVRPWQRLAIYDSTKSAECNWDPEKNIEKDWQFYIIRKVTLLKSPWFSK